jgi:hypothetical protein
MKIKLLHQLIELTRSLRSCGDLSADCKKLRLCHWMWLNTLRPLRLRCKLIALNLGRRARKQVRSVINDNASASFLNLGSTTVI